MPFPKLSDQLDGPKSPDVCQACAARWVELSRWREHDDDDKPSGVAIVLCKPCSKRLIDPHPRLYAEMDEREHHPGTMEICIICRHRVGVTCPLATFNGGPGVGIAPSPSVAFITARKPFKSGRHLMWPWPKFCTHREVLAFVYPDD